MPRASFPNQRVVKIHREPCSRGFLQIQNENWQSACRILRPQAFALYLYFAANADNFTLELSQADVMQSIGMPRSTYYDQLRVLENHGYLVFRGGNGYDFYEVPQTNLKSSTDCVPKTPQPNPYSVNSNPQSVQGFPTAAQKNPLFNREIYNTYKGTDNFIDRQEFFDDWENEENTNSKEIKYEKFVF